MAYFLVHSLASWLYLSLPMENTLETKPQRAAETYLSVLKILAISGTRGSSGFGSQSREQTERRTLLMVRAGDHWDRRMSRQMEPLELMLGW